MATKRKTYRFRNGRIIDVEEYHDGNYGAPGMKRKKKEKPTPEQMQAVNALNKARRTRQRLLEYFSLDDIIATWTYQPEERPLDMAAALKDFQKAIRYVRNQYRKKGKELFWIRNIERGTRGAWHIHLIVNRIEGTRDILEDAWHKGETWSTRMKKSKMYDEDFTAISEYITKDEYTREEKEDGTPAKPRIRESSYNTSRNMPLPEPKVKKLARWKKEPKPKKGYYIIKNHEGINPATGFPYRRYTMIKLDRRE